MGRVKRRGEKGEGERESEKKTETCYMVVERCKRKTPYRHFHYLA